MAALALAEPVRAGYSQVKLVEPLQKQLKLKKEKLEETLKAYSVAADYGVAEVVTASTYQIGALYQDFGKALIGSQRPKKLSKLELEQYNVLLEEQAFPFEEKAIELHEVNAHRASQGIYDQWVQRSFMALSELRPVRYGKTERSEGVIDAISAPAPSVIAKASAAGVPETPVDPAAQRAFDDARSALAAGRADEAERGFRVLAQSNPDLAGPHANLGLIYRRAGKLPEAVAALERAVQASPKRAVYLNQLGITYRQQGQFAKAREAYENAIALDPAYAAPLLNLGILNDLYLGDGKRALELYGQYLALSPSGDAAVSKWVADLKNRKPQGQQQAMLDRKETP
jgi:Flp pilus assembly protein TadD